MLWAYFIIYTIKLHYGKLKVVFMNMNVNTYKRIERQRKTIESLSKENDELKMKLSLQADGYNGLKRILKKMGYFKSKYEKCMKDFSKEKEKCQNLLKELTEVKNKHKANMERLMREINF